MRIGIKMVWDILLPSYFVDAYCENCGETTELRVPKGVYIYEHLKRKNCRCYHCGCRVRTLFNKDLQPNELERKHEEELKELRRKINEANNRPSFLRPKEDF
jgi:hypothetical protein